MRSRRVGHLQLPTQISIRQPPTALFAGGSTAPRAPLPGRRASLRSPVALMWPVSTALRWLFSVPRSASSLNCRRSIWTSTRESWARSLLILGPAAPRGGAGPPAFQLQPEHEGRPQLIRPQASIGWTKSWPANLPQICLLGRSAAKARPRAVDDPRVAGNWGCARGLGAFCGRRQHQQPAKGADDPRPNPALRRLIPKTGSATARARLPQAGQT